MVARRIRGELRGFFSKAARRRDEDRKRKRPGKSVSVAIPDGLDWEVWRLLTDPRIKATKREIEEDWTLEDLLDAHTALDIRDQVEALANAPQKGSNNR